MLAEAGAEVAVDFTELEAARQNLAWCAPLGIHAVVGTTGFSDQDYEEIARMKQMPLGTVKNKLFRGRQMLKEKLQDFLSD